MESQSKKDNVSNKSQLIRKYSTIDIQNNITNKFSIKNGTRGKDKI